MLPILVIFLLFQALSATNEFPDLMNNIKVSWNGTDITSKLDARLTSSLDNQVIYFYLCGPYQTYGNNGNCKTELYYETPLNQFYVTTHKGYSSTDAQLIATYDKDTYTCMRFTNPVPDFMENKKRKWYAYFSCETVKTVNPTILYGVIVALLFLLIGSLVLNYAFKKPAASSQGNSSVNGINMVSLGNQAFVKNT